MKAELSPVVKYSRFAAFKARILFAYDNLLRRFRGQPRMGAVCTADEIAKACGKVNCVCGGRGWYNLRKGRDAKPEPTLCFRAVVRFRERNAPIDNPRTGNMHWPVGEGHPRAVRRLGARS